MSSINRNNIKNIKLQASEDQHELKERLPEIMAWQQKIAPAKGAERQKLRKQFKDNFGFAFSEAAINKLQASVDNNPVDNVRALNNLVQTGAAELTAEARDQIALEDQAALGVDDKDFAQQADVIDKSRQSVIEDAVTDADLIVNTVNNKTRFSVVKAGAIDSGNKKKPVAPYFSMGAVDRRKAREDKILDELEDEAAAEIAAMEANLQQIKAQDDLKQVQKQLDNSAENDILRAEILKQEAAILSEIKDMQAQENAVAAVGDNVKDSLKNIPAAAVKEPIVDDKKPKAVNIRLENVESLKEKEEKLCKRVEACQDFASLMALADHLTEDDFAEKSFDIPEFRNNLLKVKKKFSEIYSEASAKGGSAVYSEPSFIPTHYGIRDQLRVIFANMAAEYQPVEVVPEINNKDNISTMDAKEPAVSEPVEVVPEIIEPIERRPKLTTMDILRRILTPNKKQKKATFNPENPIIPEDKKESSRFASEALALFATLNLKEEDLESIPDLAEMNGISQLLIAKSLKSLSLERARMQVRGQQSKAITDKKSKLGKFTASVSNSFRLNKQEKTAIVEQARGGLAKHGADLTRLATWAKSFNLQSKELDNNKVEASFLEGIDYESLSPDQLEIVEKFDQSANVFSSMPKHWLVKFDSVPKGSKEYKQAEQYFLAQKEYQANRKEMGNLLSNQLYYSERSAMDKLNKADAKLNMIQFMAANPELDKEWRQMIKGSSMLKKAFAKDNWKFIAGGFAGRSAASLLSGAALGATLSFVGVPMAAAAIGAWRGRDRAKKQLRAADNFIDKRDLTAAPLLAKRQAVLKEMQAMVPAEFSADPELWLVNYAEINEVRSYRDLKRQFLELDRRWREQEQKNTTKKTFKSEDLLNKTELLLNKIGQEEDDDKRKSLLGQLYRRVDFNKNLADNGLINFGSIEERTANSLDFYQVLAWAQVTLSGFNYQSTDLSYEVEEPADSFRDDRYTIIKIEVQQRAEDLLNSLEYFADKKLQASRREFIKKSMINGAMLGTVFSGVGVALHATGMGDWVADRVGDGYRFIKEISGQEEAFSVAEKTVGTSLSAVNSLVADTTAALKNVVNGGASTTEVASNINEASIIKAVSKVVSGQKEDTINDVTVPSASADAGSAEPVVETTDWSDQISNEGLNGKVDSVWQSTQEIFKNNAAQFGYDGDLQDTAALDRWSALQTNQALANSGEVADKVFSGNQVILEKVDDGFVVRVEAGTGAEPGVLSADVRTAESISTLPAREAIRIDQNIVTRNEGWADSAGARLGLKPDEVAYGGPGFITTEVGGTHICIDVDSDTFSFIDNQGQDVSYLLPAADELEANNFKDFFAQEHGLFTFDEACEEEVAATAPSAAESVVNEAPAAINPIVDQAVGGQGPAHVVDAPPDITSNFDNIIDSRDSSASSMSVAEALSRINPANITTEDKVLSEYILQNKIPGNSSLNDLLKNDAGFLMAMNKPESSIFLQFYDLRHATADARPELIYKCLRGVMGEALKNNEASLNKFNQLYKLNAFNLGSGNGGQINSWIFKIGEQTQRFDFSAKGTNDLVTFVKRLISPSS